MRPRRSALASLALAALALLLAAREARADVDESAPIFAVQNRLFQPRHEFHLGVGVLPINAFTKGITLGAGYTYHFSELWAWEIGQFTYSFGADTSLKQQLLEIAEVQPTQITSLSWFASTSAVFKPLYGKLALTNKWIVHMEVFLCAGAAVGGFQNARAEAASAFKTEAVRAGLDAGGGLRFYVSDRFSVRLDVRDYTFFKTGGTYDELFIGLAGSVTFGGGGAK